MLSIKPRFSRLSAVVVILVALVGAVPSGAASPGRYSGDLPSSFTLTATLADTDPCPTLDDPTATEVATGTVTDAAAVVVSQFFYAADPVYRKPAVGDFKLIDYDEQGNFLVWRKIEVRRLYTSQGDEALKTFRLYRISPDGKVRAESSIHTQLVRRLPSTSQGLNDLDMIVLSLGQGFSRYLPALPREGGVSGALAKRVPARLAPAADGTWELLPAKENDRLIRHARFFGEPEGPAVIEVKTSGTARFGETVLARGGEIRMGSAGQAFGLRVELKGFTPRADAALIAEVQHQVAGPFAKGTEIMDLRGEQAERVFVDEPTPKPVEKTCCVCQPVTATLSECGHLKDSKNCAKEWCITNVVNTATCAKTAESGVTSCPIVSLVPVQPMVIQTPSLLPNGGCPTGGNAVNYAVKLTMYDGCTACNPTAPNTIRTACDVDKCPDGASLDRCASPRGIRRSCA